MRLLDNSTHHFHLWMVNVYRGIGFTNLFSEYEKVCPHIRKVLMKGRCPCNVVPVRKTPRMRYEGGAHTKLPC